MVLYITFQRPKSSRLVPGRPQHFNVLAQRQVCRRRSRVDVDAPPRNNNFDDELTANYFKDFNETR